MRHVEAKRFILDLLSLKPHISSHQWNPARARENGNKYSGHVPETYYTYFRLSDLPDQIKLGWILNSEVKPSARVSDWSTVG